MSLIGNVLLLLFVCVVNSELICKTDGYEQHLGTKTPYRIVANTSFHKINVEGCSPTKVWMLVRHGTRNPNARLIELFSTRITEIRDLILDNNPLPKGKLLKSTLDSFRKWHSNLSPTEEKKLTAEGRQEMVDLAERMQARFPEVFPQVYSNSSYSFRYTYSQRTKKSAKYFAIGLFGKLTAKDVWYPEPLKLDPILRFYKMCSKWKSTIDKNPNTYRERNAFNSSPLMNVAVENVNRNLNLKNALSFEDVHLMYTTCAFETAWSTKQSPWCVAFDDESIKALEYSEDLKYYWVDGYGYELTYKQACPAFKDMFDHLQSRSKYPLAKVYFTHSGTILKMLSHLGLYKEMKPLRAADFEDNFGRNWRVSKIDAFGTNIAFILHKCGEKQKVLVLHQENVIRLPSCPDSDLCDIEKIKKFYRSSIDNCNFDEMCLV